MVNLLLYPQNFFVSQIYFSFFQKNCSSLIDLASKACEEKFCIFQNFHNNEKWSDFVNFELDTKNSLKA